MPLKIVHKYDVPKRASSLIQLPHGACISGLGVQLGATRSAVYEVRFADLPAGRVTIGADSDEAALAQAQIIVPDHRPTSVKLLLPADDGQRIVLYADIDPQAPMVPVPVWSVPTGGEVPLSQIGYSTVRRVGTVQLTGKTGPAVFHIFVDGRYLGDGRYCGDDKAVCASPSR